VAATTSTGLTAATTSTELAAVTTSTGLGVATTSAGLAATGASGITLDGVTATTGLLLVVIKET
jgi:hypothetical protein